MSQNDLVIANQTFPNTRADINSALQALGSLNSGSTAPATTYANMLWYDTTNNILKMRSEANDVWINVGYLDQGAGAFRVFDDTQVVNTSGTQTGLIGDQATAIWQAGVGTTESLVSPAKVQSAIFGSKNLSAKGHIRIGGLLIQWNRIFTELDEDFDFSETFDTAFSSAPWAITTTVERDLGTPMDAFEAYVRTSSTTGFVGRIASQAGLTSGNGYVNYIAIGQ